jgi:hypothetical protein
MSHIVTIPTREKGKKPIMPNRSKFVKEGLKSVINAIDLSSIALDDKAMIAYKYLIAFEQAINSEEYAANKEAAYLKVKKWRARNT